MKKGESIEDSVGGGETNDHATGFGLPGVLAWPLVKFAYLFFSLAWPTCEQRMST